jgi:hypothetical protein
LKKASSAAFAKNCAPGSGMWVSDSFYVERVGVRLKKASSLAAFQMGIYIYARTRSLKTQRKTEEYFLTYQCC